MKLKRFIFRIIKNFKFLPKKTFLKVRYQYYTGKELNLKNPVEFNEKIQWLKLYYHVPLLTQLADKYAVRKYVAEKIGEPYLNELYGVYENVDDINFDKFPDKFVLKGTHGSSTNILVKNKSKLNLGKAKKELIRWMKHDQYKKVGFEWAYKNIKPRIICEAYLEEEKGIGLVDYKFYCFNGIPKFIYFSVDKDTHKSYYFYDMNLKKAAFSKKLKASVEEKFDLPKNIDKMTNLATILADKLPYVRVDFYSIKEEIIFGEMTFYPSDGRLDFYPDKYNKIIGDYLQLPEIPKGQKTITAYK